MKEKVSERQVAAIENGETVLGIEFGSTRIKAVLIDGEGGPLAAGSYAWESSLVDGIWTYSLDEVWEGLRECFGSLCSEVEERYGVVLQKLRGMGVSAMMHGYLVFDESGGQLVPFRTWRNNITGRAAAALTELFDYPIPQRWSIAHLAEAILRGEDHVARIADMTTLAGYVHWKLSGEKVLGIGEASGMFPIDLERRGYHPAMLEKFDQYVGEKGFEGSWKLRDLLPRVALAGEKAGALTAAGVSLLDRRGVLEAGVPLCPPEGDAGTGMVATQSVAPRSGNISAGTSVFAMLVLEQPLERVHEAIDLVMTPEGKLVAMVHANNCTADLNAWMELFGEVAAALGHEVSQAELFERLLPLALKGETDGGGLLSFGYVAGEHLTGFEEGRPLVVRLPEARWDLANFLRALLMSSLGALRLGMDILTKDEAVKIDAMCGHGGFFKTGGVGGRLMTAAIQTPVRVLDSAGEGGAWGIALLAAYAAGDNRNGTLTRFLEGFFAGSSPETFEPEPGEVEGFNRYFERYKAGLTIERAAVDSLV
ncbi:MAG: xylulokinase [Puniceicoccaceae bacterium]